MAQKVLAVHFCFFSPRTRLSSSMARGQHIPKKTPASIMVGTTDLKLQPSQTFRYPKGHPFAVTSVHRALNYIRRKLCDTVQRWSRCRLVNTEDLCGICTSALKLRRGTRADVDFEYPLMCEIVRLLIPMFSSRRGARVARLALIICIRILGPSFGATVDASGWTWADHLRHGVAALPLSCTYRGRLWTLVTSASQVTPVTPARSVPVLRLHRRLRF